MTGIRKVLPLLVILALVAAAGLTLLRSEERSTLVAHFPRAVSVYEGSDVRVLGVAVGEVTEVNPIGTRVEVHMEYDPDVKFPADAKAVIIAPSIVGDRFIQITPAYDGGEVLADGEVLAGDRTAIPLELDQIYESIDDLTVAVGPQGANRNGALSDLLEVTAENFAGQGTELNQTITDFGKLSTTLDNNKEELFGSMRELQGFVSTLAENDQTVRDFTDSLAEVSTMLAGERQELAASLENLAVALGEVGRFVKDNREGLGNNISRLNRVMKVLVKQRAAIDEILAAGPVALNNLYLAYNPQAGTLDTNANLAHLAQEVTSDPELVLCSLIASIDESGALCDTIQTVLPRTGAFGEGGRGVAPAGDRFDPSLGGLVEVAR